ncbi:glycosyltransferase family 4 protein [Paenibacillus sp. GYB003]|uniref:glycosyltransferase family 4 protein n=1 Tax=Paenibacillus sp. GYB003 TaxID=2994392 RepID=UPI002F961F6D
MKILIVLNYYWPYISGLSEYARALAEELAKEHNVTVLTGKHIEDLEDTEIVNGVTVIRASIVSKISKGYISPSFIYKFIGLQKEMDIVNLHLPMVEAGLFAWLTNRKKIVVTYHCDINLPHSLFNNLMVRIMDISSFFCLFRAKKIVVGSYDYAENSRILPKFRSKWEQIHPFSSFYKKLKNKNKNTIDESNIIIGFCGRIVEEKGIDVLIKAAPLVRERFPNLEVIIVGDYEGIAGGSIYRKLKKSLAWDESYIKFVGKLKEDELIEFYNSIDVFILPSINSLEAFGMVQVEAMLSGAPVVASNIAGVREVVKNTGMGELIEPGNVSSLAQGIIKVASNKRKYIKERHLVEKCYGIESAIDKYKILISKIIK